MGIVWTKKFGAGDNGAVLLGEQLGVMQDDIGTALNSVVASGGVEPHTQTFDADDLTAGVLTLTTPTGYTVMKAYTIYDESDEEVGSPDGFNKSSLEMDFSSFEDAGLLTSDTTWTIESVWGPTV